MTHPHDHAYDPERDEPLFKAMDALLIDQPMDDVIPVLIIAAARAVVIEAGDDRGKLLLGIHKFHELMGEQAEEMFSGRYSAPN